MSEIFCNLCPRKCNVNRNVSLGYCGVGNVVKIARAALHHWEEPCISGTSGSGTVFFSGCSLKCKYCQNFELSQNCFGKEITVNRLAEIFLELQKNGACNINLVSPTHYSLQIIEALKIVKNKLNIPVVYNTGGYENVNTLKMLREYVDVYLTDFKYLDNELACKYSDAPDYSVVVKNAIYEMLAQKKLKYNGTLLKEGVVIRHLVLPNCRKDSINILRTLKDLYGTESFILSLMSQYTPNKNVKEIKELNRRLTTFEYESVLNEAIDLGFKLGYMQNKSSANKEFTPDFDLTGV